MAAEPPLDHKESFGSLFAATVAAGPPRLPTFVIAFVVVGAPRFVVLAFGLPIGAVLATADISGFASGFINPILGAIIFERVPADLIGRVSSLNSSFVLVADPVRRPGGRRADRHGWVDAALVVCGVAYFAATMLPTLRPEWRSIDIRPAGERPADVSA